MFHIIWNVLFSTIRQQNRKKLASGFMVRKLVLQKPQGNNICPSVESFLVAALRW
jgi:hypothetical protein